MTIEWFSAFVIPSRGRRVWVRTLKAALFLLPNSTLVPKVSAPPNKFLNTKFPFYREKKNYETGNGYLSFGSVVVWREGRGLAVGQEITDLATCWCLCALTTLASSLAISALVLTTVRPFSSNFKTTSMASVVSFAVSNTTSILLKISCLRNLLAASWTLSTTCCTVVAPKMPDVIVFKNDARVLPLPTTRKELTCKGVSELRKLCSQRSQPQMQDQLSNTRRMLMLRFSYNILKAVAWISCWHVWWNTSLRQ